MSKYTLTVREICESYYDKAYMYEGIPFYSVIEAAKDKFFNFPFEWYNDNGDGKNEFMTAFLQYYYNDYIGFETFGMWKQYFAAKMNKVMPYYKKLYAAIIKGDDPFNNVDVEYNTDERYHDQATSNSSTTTNTQSIQSDNPQVTVATNDYASSMDRGEGSTKTEGNGRADTEHEEIRSEKGIRGKTRAQLINEYKKQIVNINNELVELCKDLFLGVW